MTAIRVGHIDLGFHDASARKIEAVLARHGHEIERSTAPHEEMFMRMGRGEVDFLVSAWLPASHGTYLAPFEADVRKITVLYEPYCIWGVPSFVPAEVASVADLLREPALSRMDRLIQGINPGAGISRFSQAIVDHYGLDTAGYHFETGTEAQCFDRFEDAVSRNEWVVVPLWHPQYLHARYRIRELAEPAGLLGGTDRATLIVRRDAEPRVNPAALEELANLQLGNQRVSELEDTLVRATPPA
ncbi:glycine/betaine ABC transporter substrate-binding protein [Azorhizobium oxalatiphilum]|uniref:Glycine/betaine ABC transporter substrate-binding protein n=1 Tax=Azorhizobium oxalatiphilum TaxID=980631 RepID=A0A917CF71_9HYPH|nr:glycine betaine ABC transporter substrate-binding protein [Azorhizobium oxalatiphilum]GGF85958.1 glycine/betaine ABC transporter substrate-binding protein [Azorhizobium oxalatiphilum]